MRHEDCCRMLFGTRGNIGEKISYNPESTPQMPLCRQRYLNLGSLS